MTPPDETLPRAIARALGLPEAGVKAVLALIAEGATVPFIARYRKERTGGLDEVQIREIASRETAIVELDKRRAAITVAITEAGALTPELARRLAAAGTRAELEDLYLPFRRKRTTRAGVARERGLLPLAERILAQALSGDPRREARAFVDATKELPDAEAVLAGARDIVAELVCERVDVRAAAREMLTQRGQVTSRAVAPKAKAGKTLAPASKDGSTDGRHAFEDYADYAERCDRIPSHRYLAVVRGENEGLLRVRLETDDEALQHRIRTLAGLDRRSPFAPELAAAIDDGYARLLRPAVDKDVREALEARAHRDAAEVFAKNLEGLLLASPLGEKPVLGIDPGFRTGCKVVALSATGDLVQTATIFPSFTGQNRGDAAAALVALVRRFGPVAVAVGNGTAGRETEAFARQALADADLRAVVVVSVNEAGASVYSASDVAREEFPDLDITYRGAVSIGRRLQDPLAELVKVEPRALGVGQYQHDIDPAMLSERLGAVVEHAVHKVGVALNTASAPLLGYVAGIGPALAQKIVAHRRARGSFKSRRQLLEVPGLGPKRFEQAAGFLRIQGGEHPLDASAVHPERYPLVEKIARDLGRPLAALVGASPALDPQSLARYADADVGEPTLRDIAAELARPGRDPRKSFEAVAFRDDIRTLEDLHEGLVLEGVVTNVTAFGAFVDIGVHQDGLVHISELSTTFVKTPHDVVTPGQRLRVRVLLVDHARRRIALSARF